mgnify:CR=1 FL=1
MPTTVGPVSHNRCERVCPFAAVRDEKPAFECSAEDVGRLTDEKEREAEAKAFASQLLMPPHDFRSQIAHCLRFKSQI